MRNLRASWKPVAAVGVAGLAALGASSAETDPFQWLEDVKGERALAWVEEQNARRSEASKRGPSTSPSTTRRSRSSTRRTRSRCRSCWAHRLQLLEGRAARARHLAAHVARSPIGQPQPAWETVLDVDALAKAEGKPWVFKGADCLPPDYRRCLVSLSRGGADATVVREFDTVTKTFVTGGFTLPEAKSSVGWRSEDAVWVGTDFGDGSLTTSGYPRIVKLWKRGTPLARRARSSRARRRTSALRLQPAPRRGRYDIVLRIPGVLPAGDLPAPRRSAGQARHPGGRRTRVLFGTRSGSRCAPTGPGRREDLPRRVAAGATSTTSSPARRASRCSSSRASVSRSTASAQPRSPAGADSRQRAAPPPRSRSTAGAPGGDVRAPGLGTGDVAAASDDAEPSSSPTRTS